MITEKHPLHKLIELFAFAGGSLDGFPSLNVADVVQEKLRANNSTQFSEGIEQRIADAV